MVAAVETMAYVGQVPWHHLGVQVEEGITVADMGKAAGLDWSVSKRPVRYQGCSLTGPEWAQQVHTFKDRFVLARDSDDRPYAVVSGRYKPVQPKEVLGFFHDLVAQQGFKMHTAGSLMDGKRIWCLAETGDSAFIRSVDQVKGYLLLATSYDLTLSTIAQFTSVRVVCNNTLQQAVRDATGRVTISHVQDFSTEKVHDQLGIGRHQWEAFKDALDAISKINIDAVKAKEVMNKVFQIPEDFEKAMLDSDRIHVDNVVQLFTQERFIGADIAGQTGWGLVNAMTEYVDFRKKARNQGSRLDSAWFGDNATLKTRTLNETLLLAA